MVPIPNMPTFWYRLRRCGTLKICGLVLERVPPVGAEEAGLRDAELGVAVGIEHVAAVAVVERAVRI